VATDSKCWLVFGAISSEEWILGIRAGELRIDKAAELKPVAKEGLGEQKLSKFYFTPQK